MSLFRLSLQHIDSYAFRKYPLLTENQKIHQQILPDMSGSSRSDVLRCEVCGKLLRKWNDSLSGLVVKKRKYDIGSTYDGVTVVSNKFKDSYESSGSSGLVFQQLPDDPDFFAIRPVKSVEFDSQRRKTRFINACSKCGQYESVVGATPVYIKVCEEIGDSEFVRTDLEFGSDDEMQPLILCGAVAAEKLRNAELKGVDLIAVETPTSAGSSAIAG